MRAQHGYSLHKACKLINLPRSLYYYKPTKDDSVVIDKLTELAQKKPNEGQDKIYQRIRNQGIKWNYKRVRRVYKMLGLNKKRRIKKRLPTRMKEPLTIPIRANHTWSMDFMSDSLMHGRKFRTLNIIDDFNRQALAVEANYSMPGKFVVNILERMIAENGKPKLIRVDNGPEFISLILSEWCEKNGITLLFIQPGKPTQNGFIERFNRTFRQDILDAYIFENLQQVKILSEEWMEDYNNHRPHESLQNLSPINYKLKYNVA